MIRSRATAALLRLKEIDDKYKVRYDESKNDARSSVNTGSLVSDKDASEKNPRHSSSSQKLEILKPTLNIKIPDTCAEQLYSETSSSNEVSPSPRISIVDKTPIATPRVESTSEIQEALDDDESIDEILEESNDSEASDDIEGIYSEKSNAKNASSALSVENLSARNKATNIDYSNESFEIDTSDGESLTSGRSSKKHSESFVESQICGIREKDEISLTHTVEASFASINEGPYASRLSERSTTDETKVEDQSRIDGESRTSPKVNILPLAELNLKSRKNSSIAEDRGKNEGVSGSLKFSINLLYERSNPSPSKLEDSNSIDKLASSDELATSLEAENIPCSKSNLEPNKRSSIIEEGERHAKSSRSGKITDSPHAPSELSSDQCGHSNPSDDSTINVESTISAESADALSKSNAKQKPIRSRKKLLKVPTECRKKSKYHSHVIGNEPEVYTFESESSSRRRSSGEITERGLVSSDKQPKVRPSKIVERTASKSQNTFEMRLSRESSRTLRRKFSEQRTDASAPGFRRPSESKTRGLMNTPKSAMLNRSDEELSFEYQDLELERLRARMSDLRLEQERQLMLCYTRDSDEYRRRLTLLSSGFYCPGKSESSVIEPLDLPNVANFVKPDGTGARCGVLFPDDRLEFVRSRVADIRQWLKDQFILYRDYSDVAAAINAKYVTNTVAAEKVEHYTRTVYFLGTAVQHLQWQIDDRHYALVLRVRHKTHEKIHSFHEAR